MARTREQIEGDLRNVAQQHKKVDREMNRLTVLALTQGLTVTEQKNLEALRKSYENLENQKHALETELEHLGATY